MRKLIPLLLVVIFLFSCKKENENIIWEKTLGTGNAYFIESTQDSGFISCGIVSGSPYLVKFSSNKSIETSFTSERNGLFTSAWSDTSGFIAAGSSNGEMLLTSIDKYGNKVWDTTLTAGFYLDITSLISEGDGKFLAVGSASPDSSDNGETELLFVRFRKDGQIIYNAETVSLDHSFISSGNICSDNQGNIYLAFIRKTGSQNTKSLVVKYNGELQKLWETELYNNPDFTAASYDVAADDEGTLFVTGKCEASNISGTLDYSFLASVSNRGEVIWKKYEEISNSGSSVMINNSGNVIMLNRNCLIIRKVNAGNGSDDGTIRMYNECDSHTTDAFGSDLTIDQNGNFIVAGSKGGKYYLTLKSSQ
jgi:hypothetical protein